MSAEIIVAEHFRTLGLGSAPEEYRRLNEEPSTSSLSFDEKLAMILGAQVSVRLNRRIQRRIKEANFKIHAQPQVVMERRLPFSKNDVGRAQLRCRLPQTEGSQPCQRTILLKGD